MSSAVDIQLEQYEKQLSQWEVSVIDIVNTNVYRQWAEQNLEEMNTDHLDTMVNDATNMHFACVRPPKAILNEAMYSLGMDTNQPVERQLCLHRTFGGATINGERYVGTQRTDVGWKNLIKRACGQ